jgi:hypothetical protein
MNKQSSIDWFLNEFSKQIEFAPESELDKWYKELIPKAKAMHKEEIEEAHYDGSIITLLKPNDDMLKQSEQYYKETFGNEEVL